MARFLIPQETLRLRRRVDRSLVHAAVFHHPLFSGERARSPENGCPSDNRGLYGLVEPEVSQPL